ncbi:sugar ABC transporter ATP-binding protein, partial [Streptomyces sp. SID7982]|nr:sugar ABC transporter ATP-binding protein [Streptomyces sp. SID7982]
ISSDIEELIEGADRIVVLRGGAVAGELAGDEVDESRLLEVLADHTPGDHTPGAVPADRTPDDHTPGAAPAAPVPDTGGKVPAGQEDPR